MVCWLRLPPPGGCQGHDAYLPPRQPNEVRERESAQETEQLGGGRRARSLATPPSNRSPASCPTRFWQALEGSSCFPSFRISATRTPAIATVSVSSPSPPSCSSFFPLFPQHTAEFSHRKARIHCREAFTFRIIIFSPRVPQHILTRVSSAEQRLRTRDRACRI